MVHSEAMNDSLSDLFKDDTYCAEEMLRVRESIGTTAATQKTFDAAFKALGFMYLNCSPNMKSMVLGQLRETTVRHGYFEMKELLAPHKK